MKWFIKLHLELSFLSKLGFYFLYFHTIIFLKYMVVYLKNQKYIKNSEMRIKKLNNCFKIFLHTILIFSLCSSHIIETLHAMTIAFFNYREINLGLD